MEELFCIGCGAQIQTTDKDVAGFTPQSALEKRFRNWSIILPTLFPFASLQ